MVLKYINPCVMRQKGRWSSKFTRLKSVSRKYCSTKSFNIQYGRCLLEKRALRKRRKSSKFHAFCLGRRKAEEAWSIELTQGHVTSRIEEETYFWESKCWKHRVNSSSAKFVRLNASNGSWSWGDGVIDDSRKTWQSSWSNESIDSVSMWSKSKENVCERDEPLAPMNRLKREDWKDFKVRIGFCSSKFAKDLWNVLEAKVFDGVKDRRAKERRRK